MVPNIAECVRKFRTDFERRESPSAPYVRYLVKKVKETGILIDKPKREKPKRAKSKIITFGAQKTRTHTLKSRYTQNELLFGTNFGPDA